jgi:hypothetical protein
LSSAQLTTGLELLLKATSLYALLKNPRI